MKTKWAIEPALMLMLLGSAPVSWGQVAAGSTSPSAEATFVVVGDKHWSIGQLNQTALEFLWSKGSMPKDLKVSTSVNIYPTNKLTMCAFSYSQGFGKPYWRVEIGYNGKVRDFARKTIVEGGRPPLKQGN